MKKKSTDTVIVDIDGTLADASHRIHFIQKKPKDWKAFFDAMDGDAPNQYVIDLVNHLHSIYSIILVSGRPDAYVEQTGAWLSKNKVKWDGLRMRAAKDFRPDTVTKKEHLESLREKYNIIFAIDDRPEVVRMWRENKVPCFQVDDAGWYEPAKGMTDNLEWLEWMQSQHSETPMFKKVHEELKYLRDQLQRAIIPADN